MPGMRNYVLQNHVLFDSSQSSSSSIRCCAKRPDDHWCPSLVNGKIKIQVVFVVCGLLQIVVAFLASAIYFSVRSLTSSLEHVETIPTYTNGILEVTTFALDAVCCILCFASAILIHNRSLKNFAKFKSCQYDTEEDACYCYTKENPPEIQNHSDMPYVFNNSPSCIAIENNLRDYLVALCILYAVGVFICLTVTVGLVSAKCWQVDSDQDRTQILSSASDMEMTSQEEPATTVTEVGSVRMRQERRRTNESRLFPRISLPGMNDRLQQSVELPGSDQARLLRIHRRNGGDLLQNTLNDNEESIHRRNSSCNVTERQLRRMQPLQLHGVQRSLSDSTHSSVSVTTRNLHQLHPMQLQQLHSRRHRQREQQWRARPRRTRSSIPTRPPGGVPYLSSRMAYLNLDSSRTMTYPGCSPYPNDPPPPYSHLELPPYIHCDPAPSYRSRASPTPSL